MNVRFKVVSGCTVQAELESKSEHVPCISSPLPPWKACALLSREPRFGFCWAGVQGQWVAQKLWVEVHFEAHIHMMMRVMSSLQY